MRQRKTLRRVPDVSFSCAPHAADEAFGKTTYAIAAGGFFVPLKDHGSLTLFDLALSPPTHHVLTDSNAAKWFYHRVQWKDMNGDGLLDIVTCRAEKPIVGMLMMSTHAVLMTSPVRPLMT